MLSHVRLFATPRAIAGGLLCLWDCLSKSTGVVCHFLLQRIFPTQGSNPRHLHCTRILYYRWATGKPSHNAFPTLRSYYALGHFSSLSRVEWPARKPSSDFILFEEHLKLSLFAEERATRLSHSLGFFCHHPSLSSKHSRILSLRFNNRNICLV